MTKDNKPPMFGLSGVFKPTHESILDKSALINQTVRELSVHAMIFAPTRIGMSSGYCDLGLIDANSQKPKSSAKTN